MSVKIFNKETNQWVIFPGSIGAPGKDAYTIAQENGYKGTSEEYTNILVTIPNVSDKVNNADSVPTKDSTNLVLSGGVKDTIDAVNTELSQKVTEIESTVSDLDTQVDQIVAEEIGNQIKASIVDNLTSASVTESLSANQGRILKSLIDSITTIKLSVVEELPGAGEANIIYLVKKVGDVNDTYDEYVYIESTWEKIGNTAVDLSDYYTKTELDPIVSDLQSKTSNNTSKINNIVSNGARTISGLTIQKNGSDIITNYLGNADEVTVANITVPTSINELNPTKEDIVNALGYTPADSASAGMGDVTGPTGAIPDNFAVFNNANGKSIKDSGYNVGSFAAKSHTHTIANITDFPTIPVVDSTLSTESENAVQNKLVTTELNKKVDTETLDSKLENYPTFEDIAGLGGGDVLASGNLETDKIVLGAGTKSIKISSVQLSELALKSEIPSLSNLPIASPDTDGIITTTDQMIEGTKTWVRTATFEEGIITSGVIEPMDGFDTAALGTTSRIWPKAYINTIYANTINENGVSLDQKYLGISAKAASATVADSATVANSVTNKLTFTGAVSKEYNGSTAQSVEIPSIEGLATKLVAVDTAGKPGIYYSEEDTAINVNIVYVNADQPDAIIIVKSSVSVTFAEDYTLLTGLSDITGGKYKCYCITYIPSNAEPGTSLILVNGATYGTV